MKKETIQVIERASILLELLSSNQDKPKTIKELTTYSGLKQTTVIRIMQTLTHCYLAEQVGRKEGYKLGWKIYKISGNSNAYFKHLKECATPLIHELSEQISETIVLAGLIGNRKTIILKCQSNQDVIINDNVDTESNPLLTITGKLLMAYLPSNELEQVVEFNGGLPCPKWPALTTMEKLSEELALIRENEIATYEKKDLYHSIAIPVFEGKQTIAALGCVIPTIRFANNKADIITQLKVTASRISQNL